MKRFAMALLAATAPICATAGPLDGTQRHEVQAVLALRSCTATIEAIDAPAPTPEGLGMMAMTFGALMGFELARPGLRGDHDTLLMRLRADCQTTPNRTALDLLNTYR